MCRPFCLGYQGRGGPDIPGSPIGEVLLTAMKRIMTIVEDGPEAPARAGGRSRARDSIVAPKAKAIAPRMKAIWEMKHMWS